MANKALFLPRLPIMLSYFARKNVPFVRVAPHASSTSNGFKYWLPCLVRELFFYLHFHYCPGTFPPTMQGGVHQERHPC